ncbi:MAG: DinB family protein [Deltaproteobacteria bacterium]|nr:DinB family protein [Deltaproteobacteria bacterium]
MLKEVENYLLILNDLRNQVKNLLEKFPDEALDWRPIEGEGDPATNSATILVTHLAGSESIWIKEVIGGQPIHRNRDAEFITKGVAMAELKRRLEGGDQNTEAILSSLTSAQLEESRKWQDRRHTAYLFRIFNSSQSKFLSLISKKSSGNRMMRNKHV